MTGSGNRPVGNGFADTDWFTPVDAGAAVSTAVLDLEDSDFRKWRAEFPDFHDLPDVDENAYSGTLAITDHDVRLALGPQADELMAAADVDVDELIRLINAETTVLPVIPDALSADGTAYELPLSETDDAPPEVTVPTAVSGPSRRRSAKPTRSFSIRSRLGNAVGSSPLVAANEATASRATRSTSGSPESKT